MGWEKYRITIIAVSVIVSRSTMIQRILTIYPTFENLISSFEYQRIDSQGLALFLVTHRYDASHKKNHIELELNNIIYRLAPNGEMPGLSDIIILDLPGGIL